MDNKLILSVTDTDTDTDTQSKWLIHFDPVITNADFVEWFNINISPLYQIADE